MKATNVTICPYCNIRYDSGVDDLRKTCPNCKKTYNTSFYHGWEAYISDENIQCYVDTHEPINNKRKCPKCGKAPIDDDELDACLGRLPGVQSACCGHGERRGHITFQDRIGTHITFDNLEVTNLTNLKDPRVWVRGKNGSIFNIPIPPITKTNESSA